MHMLENIQINKYNNKININKQFFSSVRKKHHSKLKASVAFCLLHEKRNKNMHLEFSPMKNVFISK
jgi:predicted component of type VI protein secretion system